MFCQYCKKSFLESSPCLSNTHRTPSDVFVYVAPDVFATRNISTHRDGCMSPVRALISLIRECSQVLDCLTAVLFCTVVGIGQRLAVDTVVDQAQGAWMSGDRATDLRCAGTDMIRGEGILSRGNVWVIICILQDFNRLRFASHASPLMRIIAKVILPTEQSISQATLVLRIVARLDIMEKQPTLNHEPCSHVQPWKTFQCKVPNLDLSVY